MSYEVKTRVFEGPLDLLLQLITSHHLEITDLRLSDIVSEYLEYLEALRELDLEVTSEFLLIAATLVQLKARFLLPGAEDVELDDELALAEERDRLLARLLSSLTFKDVAAVLAHRLESGERFVARMAGPDPDMTVPPPDVPLGVDRAGLAAIAARALLAGDEPDLDHLDLDLPSVEAALEDLQRRISAAVSSDFETLAGHLQGTPGIIAYFLAMLELARWGAITIGQADEFAPITVAHNPDSGWEEVRPGELRSEWSR